jgi:hypothetical protein
MGLKSGENGVKSTLVNKFPNAFKRFSSCAEARDAIFKNVAPDMAPPSGGAESEDAPRALREYQDACRARTALLLDGNVIMRGVPESARSFAAFCAVVYASLRDALRAASLVVVCFDEPEHLTWAKREEQQRRDNVAARRVVQCSDDVASMAEAAAPFARDAFTCEDLDALDDVRFLVDARATRLRFFDAVSARTFARAAAAMRESENNGQDSGTLVFDGADPRGAARGPGEARRAEMFGTHEGVVSELRRGRKHPVGEGDMKLQLLDALVRELATTTEHWSDYSLIVTCTIDTDAFATALLDVARRRRQGDLAIAVKGAVHSVLAMRERVQPARRRVDSDAKSTYLVCDVQLLEGLLQQHLWEKTTWLSRDARPLLLQRAMIALVASAALCGCDFTAGGLKGSRFDHFMEALPEFISQQARDRGDAAMAELSGILVDNDATMHTACDLLKDLCAHTGDAMARKPRYGSQSRSVASPPPDMLSRAIWTCAYWAHNERKASESWGFARCTDAR